MNKYMQKACGKAMADYDSDYDGLPIKRDFVFAFEACHDILLPLLVEALPSLESLAVGLEGNLCTNFDLSAKTKDLVRRIKQVVED